MSFADHQRTVLDLVPVGTWATWVAWYFDVAFWGLHTQNVKDVVFGVHHHPAALPFLYRLPVFAYWVTHSGVYEEGTHFTWAS